MPGWTGPGYRTAVLLLAMAAATAVLVTGRREAGRAGRRERVAVSLVGVLVLLSLLPWSGAGRIARPVRSAHTGNWTPARRGRRGRPCRATT